MKTEENNYIMTSIELDEQFVDNASDSYMTDEEREYWIDLEEGDTDEETEESYQMTDEEQKGFEQYLVDTREDVPECTDALVSLFWDTYAGYSSPRQRAEEIAEEKAEEKAKRLDAGRRAKENHIPEYAGVRSLTVEAIEKLNNHFNA